VALCGEQLANKVYGAGHLSKMPGEIPLNAMLFADGGRLDGKAARCCAVGFSRWTRRSGILHNVPMGLGAIAPRLVRKSTIGQHYVTCLGSYTGQPVRWNQNANTTGLRARQLQAMECLR